MFGIWYKKAYVQRKSQTTSIFLGLYYSSLETIWTILEKEMATHSSVLAWRIPGTGEPSGLPSVGSHRVGHDWSDLAAAAAGVPHISGLKQYLSVPNIFWNAFLRLIWVNSLNMSELQEMVMDREAWRAVIHGVAKSWTWLSDWTELNWIYVLQTDYYHHHPMLYSRFSLVISYT